MEIIKGEKLRLEKRAVEIITNRIKKLISEKGEVIFGIPGGKSVKGIFEELKKKSVNWAKIHIFFVDERFVPLDNKESNYRQANEIFISELIRKGKLPKENVHPFKYDALKEDGEE